MMKREILKLESTHIKARRAGLVLFEGSFKTKVQPTKVEKLRRQRKPKHSNQEWN